jgi:hypothetical protein
VNKRDIIDEHFILTIHDIISGTSIRELEAIVKVYEELEMYEICAGINQAIKIYKELNYD